MTVPQKFKVLFIIVFLVSVLILYFQSRIINTHVGFQAFYMTHLNRISAMLRRKDVSPFNDTLQVITLTRNDSLENGTYNGELVLEYLEKDGSWQPVNKEKTIHAFSAYYIKSQRKVFIIGSKPMHAVTVICQFWSQRNEKDFRKMWETDAKVGTPNDPAGPLPFTAAIFECLLDSTDIPTHVSLVSQSNQNATSLLHVVNASEMDSYERRFTVCLAPIHSYGDPQAFVEWIELNRILGADKFVMYNYSIEPSIDPIIGYYSKRGIAEVIQWQLPLRFSGRKHIHYFGQTAALNDCLFRNKQVSEFITNIDLDEYIIPHSKHVFNWTQMINKLDQGSDGYIFRNTFFRKEWENEQIEFKEKLNAKQYGLITLKHFEHEKRIYNYFDRSKYFARTSRIHYTLIHEIPHARVVKVPIDVGLLHHYRNFESYAHKQKRIKDITVLEKFGDTLIASVKEQWKELKTFEV